MAVVVDRDWEEDNEDCGRFLLEWLCDGEVVLLLLVDEAGVESLPLLPASPRDAAVEAGICKDAF